MTTMNIELLELIAELNLSEDKSRKALASEIKRLVSANLAEADVIAAARVAELEQAKEELLDYVARAKQWFDDFGADAPIQFSNEAVMSEDAHILLNLYNHIPARAEAGAEPLELP